MKLKEKIKRFLTLDVHGHEGFTLVELIIVIAILAILSSVAVVGYSSYIKKANKAADDQLLYAINQAFRSACIDNMCDVHDIGSAEWDMDTMTVTSVRNNTEDPIVAAFAKYFEVSDPAFKVITDVVFNPLTHMFVDGNEIYTYTFGGTTITLNAKDVAILAGDNAFSNRGAAALLADVGVLSTYLTGLEDGTASSVLDEVMLSADFINAMGSYLGLSQDAYDTYGEYVTAVENAVENSGDPEAVMNNALIMYSASNAANTSPEQIDDLFSGTVTGNITIKNDDGTINNEQTMANAALVYGMYTAYLQHNGLSPEDSNFSLIVNSDEFEAYFNSAEGQADLEAYMAAMNMISDNTSNSEVTSDILNNGIAGNDELEDLMEEVMGNG